MTVHGGQNGLDRPLGVGAKPVAQAGGRASRFQNAATVLLAVTIFAGSGLIALRERPFREPPPLAVSTPEVAPSREGVVQPSQFARSSSQIIRVDPDRGADGQAMLIVRDPSMPGHDRDTAHLPDAALLEKGAHGPIPVRAGDGRRPFDVYARPGSRAGGARIAIVIGGMGVSQAGTQNALETLPPAVTLAFASGGQSLGRWMEDARREGHEIVMQVPFEPFDYPAVDPGQYTLTADADAQENRDRLHWALARTTNYIGIMNYMGGRFLSDSEALAPIMRELGQRGLMYFDDGTAPRSRADDLAQAHGVPFAASSMVLDATRERGAILAQLDALEDRARASGSAVATGSAFDVTVETIAAWAREAARRGIEVVPLSAIARDPERN